MYLGRQSRRYLRSPRSRSRFGEVMTSSPHPGFVSRRRVLVLLAGAGSLSLVAACAPIESPAPAKPTAAPAAPTVAAAASVGSPAAGSPAASASPAVAA